MESLNGGGAERVLIDLLHHFDYDRFDVTLLLVFRAGVYMGQIPPQVRVRWIWPCDFNLLIRTINHFYPIKNFVTRWRIHNALRGLGNFDTIVSYMEGVALHAHSLIMGKGHRNVTWVHSNLIINGWTNWVFPSLETEKRVYSQMDAVAFVSGGAMHAFEQKYGTEAGQPHTVIHNLIERDEIVRKATVDTIINEKPMILTIGRLDKPKRHDRLLQAVALLRDRGLDFAVGIVGIGNLENETRALCKHLGLDDMVTFYGFKSNPYPYLQAADVFVMTSDTEGLSTVIAEALCLGKPIVSTDTTGTRELLENGVGMLTELTPEAVADAIEALLRSQRLRTEYSARALGAAENFSVNKAVKDVEQIILGDITAPEYRP